MVIIDRILEICYITSNLFLVLGINYYKNDTKGVKMFMRKLSGFTLAEVLVTLGIIGVVASLTMPSLINNSDRQQFVARLKKVNSVLAQATAMAVEENETMIEDWGLIDGSNESINKVFNYYSKHLNVIKDCGNDSSGGDCVAKTQLLTLAGNVYSASWSNASGFGGNVHTFVLNDGTSLIFDAYGSSMSTYGVTRNNLKHSMLIIADVNGTKKPNQLGRDTFLFVLTQNGIVPAGADVSEENSDCKSGGVGLHCAAKVISSGSMDY